MTFTQYFIEKIIKQMNYPELYLLNFISFDNKKRSNFKNMNKLIHGNPFIKTEDKAIILAIFYVFQKTHRTLCRFAHYCKIKKAINVNINTDLRANNLSTFPENHIIKIYENKSIYRFRILDLMIIWKNALISSNYMHPAPAPLKNPFTNIPFEPHNLYNIYFKLLFSNFLIPSLIHDFFRVGFNLRKFKTNSYVVLKDLALIDFSQNGKIDFLFDDVVSMFLEYRDMITACLDPHGDLAYQTRIVNKTRHLLKYHYLVHYSLNPLKVDEAKRDLKIKLIEFDYLHFNFGKDL